MILTVILIPLGFTLLGAWLGKRLSRQTDESLEILKAGNRAFMESFTKATSTIMKFVIRLGHEELRNRYFASPQNSEERRYWHFKWRFETYDILSIYLERSEEITLHIQYDLKILGTLIPADFVGFQNLSGTDEAYIAEISKLLSDDVGPFRAGDVVCCYFVSGKCFVTKGANSMSLHPKYQFGIAGLGGIQGGSDDPSRLAATSEFHPRAKDLPLNFESEMKNKIREVLR